MFTIKSAVHGKFKVMISLFFLIKDSRQPRKVLGIVIDRSHPTRVPLHQSRLIKSLLHTHGLESVKVTTYSMSPAVDVAEVTT